MPKTELDRVKVKTLDSQFKSILKELFEYSQREAKAIVEAIYEVYSLK